MIFIFYPMKSFRKILGKSLDAFQEFCSKVFGSGAHHMEVAKQQAGDWVVKGWPWFVWLVSWFGFLSFFFFFFWFSEVL